MKITITGGVGYSQAEMDIEGNQHGDLCFTVIFEDKVECIFVVPSALKARFTSLLDGLATQVTS